MKIRHNTHIGKVQLNTLAFGDVFVWDKAIMILTDITGHTEDSCIAVNLRSGISKDVASVTMVKALKVTLAVEG